MRYDYLSAGHHPAWHGFFDRAVAHDFSYANTFASTLQHAARPVLQEIGEELDTRNFSFSFRRSFAIRPPNWRSLKQPLRLKTPLPLVLGNGVFNGKRYVVESLSGQIIKTSRSGAPVRIEATIGLLEDPVAGGLFSLITSIAKARAPALSARRAIIQR